MFGADRRLQDRRCMDTRGYGANYTTKVGPGNWHYRQFPDGSIHVMGQGVAGGAATSPMAIWPTGHAKNKAVTDQIGDFATSQISFRPLPEMADPMVATASMADTFETTAAATPTATATAGTRKRLNLGRALTWPLGQRTEAQSTAWKQSTPKVTAARTQLTKAKGQRRVSTKQARLSEKETELEAMGMIVAEEMFGPW